MRSRLDQANGHHDNQIIWTSEVLAPSMLPEAFPLTDEWLTAIEADRSGDQPEVKVVRSKPAAASTPAG